MRLEVHLRHRYASGFAIEVDFTTSASTTSLFGPSGSGKTSMLLMIAGLVRPHAGRVHLNGRDLLDTARRVDCRPETRRIGFVFQDLLLFPHLSIEGNLRYGEGSAAGPVTFDKVVEILELEALLRRKPATLSGGQKQRVALGRALLRNPELLIMDEPLTSLDEALKSRVLTYLERVVREWGTPILYVSHSQVEVKRLAEWTVVLDAGRVIDSGPTADVLGHRTLLQQEGDLGPVNLLEVREVGRDPEGNWHGRIGSNLVLLPELQGTEPTVLVRFSPSAVTLAQGTPDSSSVRNRLAGEVKRLVHLRDRVLVEVDVGQKLWAEITRDACRDLALGEGQTVTCLIKTRAMSPIS